MVVWGQVTPCYPKETEGFVTEVIGLLDMHAATLDSALRQSLVKALILMRNRNTVRPPGVRPPAGLCKPSDRRADQAIGEIDRRADQKYR